MSDDTAGTRLSLLRVRVRYFLARVVQFAGFYFIFLSLWSIFDPLLADRGLGVAVLPAVVRAPLAELELSPILTLVIGFVVVWFATSAWFLGTPQVRG